MPKFNDIDISRWKEYIENIWLDSLWIINKRDNSKKHSGFYHGNFVPQIPRQLILRYTKKYDTVLDLFCGSGTTIFEAEDLERNAIGVDLNQEMIDYVNSKIDKHSNIFLENICEDSSKKECFYKINEVLNKNNKKFVDLVILHPPYFDIIKFSNNKNDLSNSNNFLDFIKKFILIVKQAKEVLKKDGYLSVVIGDKYQNGEIIPMGFYCMNEIKKLGFVLKGVIIKNMEGNRAKAGKDNIWKYRALSSDYFIFKHEYIFIFKK